MADNSTRIQFQQMMTIPGIGEMLNTKGPVVTCVILRAARVATASKSRRRIEGGQEDKIASGVAAPRDHDKPAAVADADEKGRALEETRATKSRRLLYEDLIEEIEIDTSPQKNEFENVLGGPFTFVGQYHSEGTILMALRGFVEEETGEKIDSIIENERGGTGVRQCFESMPVGELRAQCRGWAMPMENMPEKQDTVDALKRKEQVLPPINPHPLRPPFHNTRVRGDIVIIKVAEVEGPLDDKDGGKRDDGREGNATDVTENTSDGISNGPMEAKDGSVNEAKQASDDPHDEDCKDIAAVQDPDKMKKKQDEERLPVSALDAPSNKAFFLPYTKKEYLAFASRTDIPLKPVIDLLGIAAETQNETERDQECSVDDDGNADENEEDDENDGDYQLPEAGMEELTEEEEKSAMLNIVMSELLRKFREENSRGANSQELLEIRASVAEQLGMTVATYDARQAMTEGEASGESKSEEVQGEGKRVRDALDIKSNDSRSRKRVKFENSLDVVETKEDDGNPAETQKMAAKE